MLLKLTSWPLNYFCEIYAWSEVSVNYLAIQKRKIICHCIYPCIVESIDCTHAHSILRVTWKNKQKNLQNLKARDMDYLGKHVKNCKKWSLFHYSRVSGRREGRNKRGGWQISVKIINGQGAINGEVDKNHQS